MPGLFYEALTERRVIDADWHCTVTDTVLFRALAMSVQTLHLDADLARGTAFGRKPVRSLFTPSLMMGGA
jgi:acyl dehydratase